MLEVEFLLSLKNKQHCSNKVKQSTEKKSETNVFSKKKEMLTKYKYLIDQMKKINPLTTNVPII